MSSIANHLNASLNPTTFSNCSICCEKIKNEDAISLHVGEVLPNGDPRISHVFDRACLRKWIVISRQNPNGYRCPICRDILPDNIVNVLLQEQLAREDQANIVYIQEHVNELIEEDWHRNLIFYINKGRLKVVNWLMINHLFSPDFLDSSLIDAVVKDRLSIVDRLLQDPSISLFARGLSLKMAVRKNSPDLTMIDHLLQAGEIFITDWNNALHIAVQNGREDIIRLLWRGHGFWWRFSSTLLDCIDR